MDIEPQIPPSNAPAAVSQGPVVGQEKHRPVIIWIIAGIVITLGIMILSLFRSPITQTKPPLAEVTDTPFPTPTPIRNISAIATQSAFISLEQSASSLSSGIANTNLDDPSLSPPTIDLPLGFVE